MFCKQLQNHFHTRVLFQASVPDSGRGVILLMSPRPRPVDGVTIDLKPRPHASQSLLEDGRDSSVVRWSDAQQQVATAAVRSSQFSIYQTMHKSYYIVM